MLWKQGKEKINKGEVVLVPFGIRDFTLYAKEKIKCLITEIR
jgi:hypothetical protein